MTKTQTSNAASSFSLEGEDLILSSLLRDVGQGTYIDAGANHPTQISNTYFFYQRGWTGLAVDGNEAFAPLWAEQRPKDTFVTGLLSDTIKDAEFIVFPDDTMSSMDAETTQRYKTRFTADAVATRCMQTVTLRELRQTHLSQHEIHLLSVDVEGEEVNVLKGSDLATMQPGVIVVETKSCSLYQPMESGLVRYLTGIGYRFIAKTPLNAFFIWPDKPYLAWIPRSLLEGA